MATEKIAAIPQVNWEHLFDINEWHITPEVLSEHWQTLLISLSVVVLAFAILLIARAKGISTKWWKDLQPSKYSLPESTFLALWFIFYLPLAIGAWLVWIQSGNEWTRPLTVYSALIASSALFGVSLYIVQDISLALLNILTILGIAMFTTTQFGQVLHFASVINTPYLFFLLYLLFDFSYFWYINEGKDALDINQLKGLPKKTKVVGMPEDIKEEFRQKLAKDKAEAKVANKKKTQ
jgi:tryptophan-rich sensory protein